MMLFNFYFANLFTILSSTGRKLYDRNPNIICIQIELVEMIETSQVAHPFAWLGLLCIVEYGV